MWGLGVLGWGFVRGGVRFVEWTSHGGSRLPALDAHVFEGAPFVLRWVHGVCFSLWWRGSVGGSLDDVKRSKRRCWTGSLVSPCVLLSRRVFLFGGCLLWVLFAFGVGTRAGSPRSIEDRVRGAGQSRRRARGDGVLVWSGVALPCLCGGSRRRVFSREGASDVVSAHFCSRSRCVRKVVFVYEHTEIVFTTTTT